MQPIERIEMSGGHIPSANMVWYRPTVGRQRREAANGHRAVRPWFTGLSGAGKSAPVQAVEEQLHQAGCRTFVLDGDNVCHGMCSNSRVSNGP